MENSIQIRMFQAMHGDSFLIRCREGMNSINILVDAGPEEVYVRELKPVLEEMKNNGESIDLFIVTHIDDDHIGGAIALIEDNGFANQPNVISIREVWHNSYRHMQKKLPNTPPLNDEDRRWLIGFTKRWGRLLKARQKGKRTVSARQGSALGALLLRGGYSWNSAVDGRAINIQTLPTYLINNLVCLKLLSPQEEQLANLKDYWYKELKKQGFKGNLTDDVEFDDAYEYFMAAVEEERRRIGKRQTSSSKYDWEILKNNCTQEDKTVKNGSSIAFVLEFDDERLLFAADAFPSVIAKSVRMHYPNETTPCQMSAIKISHHGSKYNTSIDFLNRVDAPLYLISTNGARHGHPDVETLIKIINRPENRQRTLMFNYETNASRYLASSLEKLENHSYSVVHKSIIDINKKGEYSE
ncbi:AVAST type 1 anti-phage system MBL fold metallo-hydrolase Avs1a [Bacillus wiedmannii]|uniref:AVAST type 1 anti-phage system MBL fold metallo-hydrolase Avs1a n=1 Tax=Bacillus wiedmannii TaxID=1890302 RepID=UPI0028531AB6|nr:AVAST type 1 anti-phage system MBL fold metallo-hydrolase Avs1a [Bacillus wiedmannii]MDR4943061.1 AVAST type 1 anti-phage system MBL fold metallo-hydrolase Avs1a [Bacillus wiedmannii]